MSNPQYLCPECRSPLAAFQEGEFDAWECKAGHGLAMSLSEAHARLQEDEVEAIWKAARSAPRSGQKSPLLGQPMAEIAVTVDDDEVAGNAGAGAREVGLQVAVDEQFLWFASKDFSAMPGDLPDAAPSDADRKAQAALAEQSRAAIAKDLAAREDSLDRLAMNVGSRATALHGIGALMRRLGR